MKIGAGMTFLEVALTLKFLRSGLHILSLDFPVESNSLCLINTKPPFVPLRKREKSSKVDSRNKNIHCSIVFGKIFISKIGPKIQIIILNQ